MILINNQVMDLVLGYNIVREAERKLSSKWRTRLLSAYVQKRRARTAGRTAYEPPEHPLHGDLKAQLLGSLLSDWHQCLEEPWVPEDRPGDIGENALVNLLQQMDSPGCFFVHGLRQRQGDDVDVTVVGPIGIWVFEVKLWRDKIEYYNGTWHYDPPHLERKQPPDKQWARMAKDVKNALLGHDMFLISRVPEFETIQGGIVFAHPDAHLDIIDCPVKWGKMADWQKRLGNVAPSPQVNEGDVLAVLDALLTLHHGVELRGIRSMQGSAQQLVQEAEARLEAWTRVHSEDDIIVFPVERS